MRESAVLRGVESRGRLNATGAKRQRRRTSSRNVERGREEDLSWSGGARSSSRVGRAGRVNDGWAPTTGIERCV